MTEVAFGIRDPVDPEQRKNQSVLGRHQTNSVLLLTLSVTSAHFCFPSFKRKPSAVVIQVVQKDLVVGGEARAGTQAVQASSRRAAGHQPVMLQLLQAERRRAAVHHQHLHPRPVWVPKPLLGPLACHSLLLYSIFFFLFLLLFSLQLLLLMVDLPQQVVDEDGAPQVGLGVFQEPQLLQGQLQDAAAVLLQYQVLRQTTSL